MQAAAVPSPAKNTFFVPWRQAHPATGNPRADPVERNEIRVRRMRRPAQGGVSAARRIKGPRFSKRRAACGAVPPRTPRGSDGLLLDEADPLLNDRSDLDEERSEDDGDHAHELHEDV